METDDLDEVVANGSGALTQLGVVKWKFSKLKFHDQIQYEWDLERLDRIVSSSSFQSSNVWVERIGTEWEGETEEVKQGLRLIVVELPTMERRGFYDRAMSLGRYKTRWEAVGVRLVEEPF